MTPDLRAADRRELEQLTARFLSGGGAVTALDHAGRVVGVATEDLPELGLPPLDADLPVFGADPVELIEQALPCAGAALLPDAAQPEPAGEPAPGRTLPEALAELRAIRAVAEALTARLDALLARGDA